MQAKADAYLKLWQITGSQEAWDSWVETQRKKLQLAWEEDSELSLP